MPGLGPVQAAKQVAQGSTDGLSEGRETLARSRFDECAANHQIDLALRLARRHQLPHARCVTPRRQALRYYLQDTHHFGDLFVMPEFFARQPRHLGGQIQIFRIGEHQAQRGRSCLLLAIGMIDQQYIAKGAGMRHPGGRSRRAQQRMRGLH